MKARGWFIIKLHGGKYQSGLPDLVAMHILHGIKWIETKAPGGKLRPSQIEVFAMMSKVDQQVYILEDEKDYMKIFKPKGNWMEYIRI